MLNLYGEFVQPAMEVLENHNAVPVTPIHDAPGAIPLNRILSRERTLSTSTGLPPDEVALDGFDFKSSLSHILRVQSDDRNRNVDDDDSNMTRATTLVQESSTGNADFSIMASINRIRSMDSTIGNHLQFLDNRTRANTNDDETSLAPPPLLPFHSMDSNIGRRTLARMRSFEDHEVSLGALSNDTIIFSRNLSDSG